MADEGKTTLKPGEVADVSGIYKDTKSAQRTTIEEGLTAPPTPKPGGKWKLVDRTNPPRKKR
jgi:hypothetical protein